MLSPQLFTLQVKGVDGKLYRGALETDLEAQGYTKAELKKLSRDGTLKKGVVVIDGGWRNVWSLLSATIKE